MSLKRIKDVLALTLAIVLLVACTQSSSVPPLPPVPTVSAPDISLFDPVGTMNYLRGYYNRGVNDFEKPGNIASVNADMTLSRLMTGVNSLTANQTNCNVNAAKMQETVGTAVMQGFSPDQMADAFINAQALTVSSVAGDAAAVECAKLSRQIADYVIAGSVEYQNAFMNAYSIWIGYIAYLADTPEVKAQNDLLNYYGGNTAILNQKLTDNGLPTTGVDIYWLPTKELVFAQTSDKNLVDYYRSGKFIEELDPGLQLKYKGHEDALPFLYMATWNSGTNTGMLYRMAALYGKFLVVKLNQGVGGSTMPDSLVPTLP